MSDEWSMLALYRDGPFKGIRPGARVKFTAKQGDKVVTLVARVNPLLIFEEHVQVSHGHFGTRVDADNYVSHVNPKEGA